MSRYGREGESVGVRQWKVRCYLSRRLACALGILVAAVKARVVTKQGEWGNEAVGWHAP